MPGVPSGRGCDACRKQKKKCDQSKPRCARCTRLDIPCVGNGKQRFKFQVVEAMAFGGPATNTATATSAKKSPSRSPVRFMSPAKSASDDDDDARKVWIPGNRSLAAVQAICRMPNNETFTITNALVSRLEIDDLSYDLDCYGPFLKFVPQRLGHNAALDASASALVTTFSPVHGYNSVQAITKYIEALKALRTCLSNPGTARSADTMCAVYLMMICQGWMGRQDDQRATHAEGMALLLEATAGESWFDNFEMEMRVTMCIPVIVESIINPRIKLGPWLYQILDGYGNVPDDEGKVYPLKDDPNRINTLRIRNLARFPDYLHQPEVYRLEILFAYHTLLCDIPKLQNLVAAASNPAIFRLPYATRLRMKRSYETCLGVLSGLGLVLNYFLRAFDPADDNLIKESDNFLSEVTELAGEARSYRPIGASWVPLCLILGWACTDDREIQARFENLLIDYQQDYIYSNYLDVAKAWKMTMQKLCPQLAAIGCTSPMTEKEQEEVLEKLPMSECCIL